MSGGERWTVNRLATELGLPAVAVAQMTRALEKAGLLVVTEKEELLPSRDIGNIRVYEMLEIARTQSSGHVAPRHVPIASVDRLLAQLEDQRRNRCGELTLRDLVDDVSRPQLSVARGTGS